MRMSGIIHLSRSDMSFDIQCIPNSRLAFAAVIRMTSSSEISLSSAIALTTYGRYKDEFLFPLKGTGARYGQSVSRIKYSIGVSATTSFSFFAFLKVTTPPIPR